MHLQRLLMPDGRVSWTAMDGDQAVEEVREFVLHLEARNYAPSTVHHYVRHVVRLANYLASDGQGFDNLTPAILDRFIPAQARERRRVPGGGTTPGQQDLAAAVAGHMNILPLRPQPVVGSPALHNQIVYAIHAFCQFRDGRRGDLLFERRAPRDRGIPDRSRGFLDHITSRRVTKRVHRRIDGATRANAPLNAALKRLSPEEVAQIAKAATSLRDTFLVLLLYTSGMRIGEARGLRHEDFDTAENTVWVRPRENENGARVKNRRGRPVIVPNFVGRMFEDYICSDEYLPAFESGTDYVFCNIERGRIGRGLTESNCYSVMRGLIRRSGVKFHWHQFRHTNASELIAAGYSLLEVADHLGHIDPNTTNQIYKHLLNREYRKLMLREHPDLHERIAGRRPARTLGEIPWA